MSSWEDCPRGHATEAQHLLDCTGRPRRPVLPPLETALLAHHPTMRSETGPFSGCRCGGVRPGESVTTHVVAELRAVQAPTLAELRALIEAQRHEVVEDCWYTCAAATEERDGGTTCNDERLGKPCDCGRDKRVSALLALVDTLEGKP